MPAKARFPFRKQDPLAGKWYRARRTGGRSTDRQKS